MILKKDIWYYLATLSNAHPCKIYDINVVLMPHNVVAAKYTASISCNNIA